MNLDKAVRENAQATYLGLVENIEGASVSKPHGVTLVRGPGNFSFCNFAISFDLEGGEVESVLDLLVQNANECEGFCVFSSTADSTKEMERQLLDKQFRVRQSLTCMASNKIADGEIATLNTYTDKHHRLAVTRFMASQFFGWMSRDARESIALATALSRHTVLCVGPVENPQGAVMLVEFGGVLGLYNLCVKENERGHSIGSNIVRAVQSIASKNSSPVGILCESALVSWYQCQRFERVGSIDVYCCETQRMSDILKSRG